MKEGDIEPTDPRLSQEPSSYTKNKKTKKHLKRQSKSRKIYIVSAVVVVLIGIVIGFFIYRHDNSPGLPNPLSKSTMQSLGFNLYYPSRSLLPGGYTLNMKSFSANNLAIVYSVSYGNNNKIVFSVQEEPSKAAIQSFYSGHMPLYTSHQTSIGTAAIGAVNLNQTLVSLPTNTNAWLLITAPSNINQNQLIKVLDAIRIAR